MDITKSTHTKSHCGRFHICIIGEEGSKHYSVPHTTYNHYMLSFTPEEDKKKFGIEVKNYHSLPCIFQLHYQGVDIGRWILKPYQLARLYHPIGDRSAFEVSRINSAHGQKLGFKEKDEMNGKIDVKVTWKKQAARRLRSSAASSLHWRSMSTTKTENRAVPQYMSTAVEHPTANPVFRSAVAEAGLGLSADTTKQDYYEEGNTFTLDETTTDRFSIRLLIKTTKVREAKSVAQYSEEQRKRQAPALHLMDWA